MRYLLPLLLLSACAPMEAKSLVCIGWCAQQEMKKGESPVTPVDVIKEIKDAPQPK